MRTHDTQLEHRTSSATLGKRLELHDGNLSLQLRIGRSRWPTATQTVRKFDCEITTTEELEREEARLTG
jgi:hypothetical protein